MPENTETAILGGGCFWCVEAAFEKLDGVLKAESGYEGGASPNPTYKQVCSGTSGHAEVVKITYNPKVVSFESILGLFFRAHDPTQLNRQGADVGTQYRSVIYYTSEEQKTTAEQVIKNLETNGSFSKPIVTELSPHATFYIAEDYHQDYYEKNPFAGYCMAVIRPKLKKLNLD